MKCRAACGEIGFLRSGEETNDDYFDFIGRIISGSDARGRGRDRFAHLTLACA